MQRIEDKREKLVQKLGENIVVRRITASEDSADSSGFYLHSNNKIGSIVSLKGGTEEIAKDIAMHVAATDPMAISPDEIPQEVLDKEREIFLDILLPNKNGMLISLHNNFRGYNVHKEKGKSQRVSIKRSENPRDFIICTNNNDFEILSSSPYNVVLQNKVPEKDDGSLSWEALRRNVRYLNIETRLGYLSKQKEMLKYIEDNLN